ncbi:MAG: 50S ribosomal protein L21 [Candidatus Komeilibacteria bacterium RIFCSPLOWO2_01_FULL_53_11]|uniref:Large ribosomal subunit protein bL21 n=1 Tax=Candidatus Komeilibacteria bacterium RIFCSPLOWO2_01_FULL_53_11 TaxID=1798552 RepID=A0A1G2BUJ0_9BACT|nr:MAG: 50S ribosomal protein L21 [Candidatus Komeilibacteria bacterium RIFCSPLOWO2_01_FULL_53_11]
MFAIIQTGGKQYKVREKDTIRIEKVPASERVQATVTFRDVLLVSDDANTVRLGAPVVAGASVTGTILRDSKAKKIRVVKYKPKTRYKKEVGHRQLFTEVRIEKIVA